MGRHASYKITLTREERDKLVELKIVPSVSAMTVCNAH